jgi:hypothetical protein
LLLQQAGILRLQLKIYQVRQLYASHITMENSARKQNIAKRLILKEINNVFADPSVIKYNGCAACHILFRLVENIQTNESDAADLLSEILLNDQKLNDLFIEMVENIHMKQRMMGIPFSMKDRDAKDKYIESNFKNLLTELCSDAVNYGPDTVLRRLLISAIALEIAQNVGIDYHAANEELYYYMRKYDEKSHKSIVEFIDAFYRRSNRKAG